jgi:hypothetical protein
MERVTFTPAAKVAGAVVALLMIGLLAVNNLQIAAQLRVVSQQRDFQAKTDPLVRDGRRLADAALRDREQTRRDARAAAALVRESRPLVGDLRDTLPTVGALAESLATRNRLITLVDSSTRLVNEFERTGFLRRAPDLAEQLLAIQREALALQREALALNRETLAVAKETLQHARSIDAKTGGTAPPLR